MPKLFPTPDHENLVICVFSFKFGLPLISNYLPDLHINGDSQCFPLFFYEKIKEDNNSLFKNSNNFEGYARHDGVTDYILEECKSMYGFNIQKITKIMILYYVYGILHSPDYRETFSADLKKDATQDSFGKKCQRF
jgi:predicted helicase